jgi:hypothetical protein
MADHRLYPVNRTHLAILTGPLGIWQHATGAVPDPAFGVCTDDVARALAVDLAHARTLGLGAVEASARRSLRFLDEAFDPDERRFRNFRGADGGWARSEPSEDSQGRAMLALGTAIGGDDDIALGMPLRDLFAAALAGTGRLTALRAIASTVLGCVAALDGLDPGDPLQHETERALRRHAGALRDAFARTDHQGAGWPWPEPTLTYENALLPRALIVAGDRLGDEALRRRGLRVLDWLIEVQSAPDGTFSPIGNRGWWPRGGHRARFDQQPIEAATTIAACLVALRSSSMAWYGGAAERAYGWFLGDNDVGVAVAVPSMGGCRDGLEPAGVNLNQGAESTLMWLTALEGVRDLRVHGTTPPTAERSRVLAVSAGQG